jgi:predicted phosphodiesterase
MIKKVIIISDVHLETGEEEHSSYSLVKKFFKAEKPDILIINGDLLDFSYIGVFNKEAELLRENKRLKADYDLANKDLDFFQKYAKKVIYLQGNHERRVDTIIEKYPNYLKDCIELESNLNLKQRNIQWIREVDQPYKMGKLYILHGQRYSINFAKATLEDMGGNTVVGHTHRIQSFSKKFWATGQEICCWGVGCLCNKNPEWQKGKPNCWMNGFAYVVFDDDGIFTMNNLHIIKDKFILNGKVWVVL